MPGPAPEHGSFVMAAKGCLCPRCMEPAAMLEDLLRDEDANYAAFARQHDMTREWARRLANRYREEAL